VYAEDDLVPLSALQHWAVCPRQAALIHLEQAWSENLYTTEGRIRHRKVDRSFVEKRKGVKATFGLRIRSLVLGVAGRADAVEFHRQPNGSWRPYPVEHKRGRSKKNDCDRIQLCAQAICLEEMLGVDVPEGALFYGKARRREVVEFCPKLRSITFAASAALHAALAEGRTPPAAVILQCKHCSLRTLCLPDIWAVNPKGKSARRYLTKALRQP
jgi:CRISPR-associated exonuclease Cas4